MMIIFYFFWTIVFKFGNFDLQAKPACLSSHAKVLGNGNFKAASGTLNQSHNTAQMHLQGHMRPIPGLTASFDKKVCFLLKLVDNEKVKNEVCKRIELVWAFNLFIMAPISFNESSADKPLKFNFRM